MPEVTSELVAKEQDSLMTEGSIASSAVALYLINK
jgi:hypothetical protein